MPREAAPYGGSCPVTCEWQQLAGVQSFVPDFASVSAYDTDRPLILCNGERDSQPPLLLSDCPPAPHTIQRA